MYHIKTLILLVFFAFGIFLLTPIVHAQTESCQISDSICVLLEMEKTAAGIENTAWRDQTYREIAKSLAAESKLDLAIGLIEKIETPDTKAMTIRGIGMEAAKLNLSREEQSSLFTALRKEAEKISHPPSYAIALTYIAMGQAFSGDNEGAWKTASEMENDALRHKAYGETAEIQAEKGDVVSAKISISKIDSNSYKDKSRSTVSRILADAGDFENAYDFAMMIDNPYKKTLSLQYILDIKAEPPQKKTAAH